MNDNDTQTGGEESGAKEAAWERDLIGQIALQALEEQRRARRWGVFFKSLLFVYLFVLLALYLSRLGDGGISTGEHTALVDIEGVIGPDTAANADTVVAGLRAAFEDENTKAVIVRINSPGGSPVQAGYINNEIRRLRKKYPDTAVYAVITDICASGGYYVAAAADAIYADKASMVGSIGAVFSSFGFTAAMEKLGIERRVLTAGERKGFLDPFQPMDSEDVAHVRTLLGSIHEQFIDAVKKGRGDKLKPNDELFTGLVWTGQQSVELGLVDGLGSSGYVAREVVGVEKIVDFTRREDYLERFFKGIGATIANALAHGALVR